MGKHKAIMIEKIKEGLYTLQDSEHGLEACGETEGVYIGLYKLCISGRYHLPVFYLIL